MSSKLIFQALETGKISLEEAKKEIMKMIDRVPEQSAKQDFPGSSEEQRLFIPVNGNQSVVTMCEIEPNIVQVTMQDRAYKNTFTDELVSGLIQSFESIQANPSYKVVILTGYDSYFASGGTKEGLLAIGEGKFKFTEKNFYRLALDCKIPVIAAMQGHGIGAGWCLGMSCDFIVMSLESFYTSNYMKYGFTPGFGATLIFPEKFGNSLAQEILFTGKRYSGSELKSRGIPFPVLPRKEVLSNAIRLAKELSESPRESLIALKDHMVESIRKKLSTSIAKEIEMHERTYLNQPEVRERIESVYGQLPKHDQQQSLKLTTQGNKVIQQKSNNKSQDQLLQNSIAIIGMSGQFPKSGTLSKFWDNLASGTDCISEIPADRWSIENHYDKDPSTPGKTYSKWMGVLEDAGQFDPLFFNISPTEAEMMDPQQRLFLENCWRCIEDAGLRPSVLSESRCGVFVGCVPCDYKKYTPSQALNAQSLLGAQTSILSARVAYLLNLKGPCLAIDTACSSSLVAIAEACNSLILHTSDLALAGGVCLLPGPSLHIMGSKSQMLSADGRCFTFDNRANGFVPGEGVGVVLLKRLSDAIRDQDPIYGVVRGWGVNQDGKTNGITAPSVNSQISLEKEVYQRFNINPETIAMVETHGTGTKLGDPIEVEALTKSFQSFTDKKNFCALTAVKSNIGHLLTAAGAAGVLKVLLALQHKMLPPTINYEKLNEHISLDNSPFYVNNELETWEATPGTPRRAAVSAFGFSGTNAHLVIEEYIPEAATPVSIDPKSPNLFVLSAKSEAQLKTYAECMKNHLESHEDLNLVDMAYTLQIGRDAMDYRVAFLADSKDALLKALEGFINNKPSAAVLTGQVKKGKEGMAVLEADEDGKALLQTWVQKKKLKKIADLWVKGLSFDWNQLYPETKSRRISLPTYPFAEEYYWMPESESVSKTITTSITTSSIHPLLHQNTSDLTEQRFTSIFTGQEFFLADHIVKGEKILPGVAYLEIARAAVEQAAKTFAEEKIRIKLKNIFWARPVTVGERPVQVHIGLHPEETGQIAYEIYSQNNNKVDSESNEVNVESIVHSQGVAVLSIAQEIPALDLGTLQAECTQSLLSASKLYEAYKAMGIDYGPAHQGVEQVYIGQNQILARLILPPSVTTTRDKFILHPSLMDSALQASLGLLMGAGTPSSEPILPFALEEIEIFGNCTSSMWAHVRPSTGSVSGDKLQKLDIDLCDDQGHICVRMKSYTSRIFEAELSKVTFGTLMLEPSWKEQTVAHEALAPDYAQHLVILCEPDNISPEDIAIRMNKVHCLVLQSSQPEIGERFQIYAAQVFEEIQSILMNKPQDQVLIQIVVSNLNEQQLCSGLSGLLKTAQMENPKLIGQMIGVVEPGQDPQTIIEQLKENSRSPLDQKVRYQDGKRFVAGWREMEASAETTKIPWKDRGAYLITGGAGGLGLIFAREIAYQVKDATLILTGRSPLAKDRQAKLKELETSGARIIYRQVDVTDKKEVTSLIKYIRREFGNLDGIIHAAGIVKDNFIIKKTREEFLAVLAPKVAGLVNLDQASQDQRMDFFILFSSTAGTIGNPGQADYSTANAFMDAYAHYRDKLVTKGQRYGRTLSINWSLWQEGGMSVDKETEMRLQQSTGIVPIQTNVGIQAFYQGLASGETQVLVAEGNLAQLRCASGLDSKSGEIMKPKEKISVSDESLRAQTLNLVKQILVDVVGLSPEKIQLETQFEKYGIDSIIQVNIIRELEKVTGELSKTLLFEYNNTQELVDYLVKNQADKLSETIAPSQQEPIIQPNVSAPPYLQKKQRFVTLRGAEQILPKQETEDIAIIGISGRYPMSNTFAELWEHLKAGDNCITEVPSRRWNTSLAQTLSNERFQYHYEKYYGGFLDNIDRFDHRLFEIARDQVMELPPEVRLFLEIVWETLEDAGYTKPVLQDLQARYQKGVGVFVGAMYSQYPWSIPSLELAALSSNGTDWQIANRTSHFFNLTGPSIAVNSACSSSLTAIHLACESLKQKTCSMAIAGGVNLTLDLSKFDALQRTKFLGSGNLSKSFGAGDGYIPGEGVGAVLLKPLSLAIKDHDRIDAVIKSSFVNHSGGRQAYTVPDPKQQAQLLLDSIQRAGIDPSTISYVESAANGSELGDPIELRALSNVFGQYTDKKQYCALGSVKSNLGHLEAASGISQLSKVLLQLKHKTLVPSINANPRNPNIKLESSPFYLQETTSPWNQLKDSKTGEILPRRSMINSFGAGGAYTNLIIEEYMGEAFLPASSLSPRQEYLIIFSAKTKWSLMKYLQEMQGYLTQNVSLEIGDIEQSLQKINHNLAHRVAFVVSSIPELLEKLDLIQGREGLVDSGIYTSIELKFNGNSLNPSILKQALEKRDLRQLAQYWVTGATVDFRQLHDLEIPSIQLPKYAFDHDISFAFGHGDTGENERITIENDYNIAPKVYVYNEPCLRDHTVYGEQVLIGMTHVSLAINAFYEIFPQEESLNIQRLNFVRPIVVKEDQRVEVLVIPAQRGTAIEFRVMYRYASSEIWDLAATGNLQKAIFEGKKIDIESIKDSLAEDHHLERIYTANPAVGLGDSFKKVTHLYTGKDMVLARVDLSQIMPEENHGYILHPLFNSSILLAMAPLIEGKVDGEDGYLPFGIKDIHFQKTTGLEQCWLLLRLVKNSGEMIVFDADLINDQSQVVACFSGCSIKRLRSNSQIPGEDQLQQQSSDSYSKSMADSTGFSGKIQKYLSNKLAKKVPDQSRLSNFEANFMDLGLGSSQLVTIVTEIAKEANIELYPTLFFEYPNIKELTEFLSKEHEDSFRKLLGSGAGQSPVYQSIPLTEGHTSPKLTPSSWQPNYNLAPTLAPSNINTFTQPVRDDIAVIGMHGLFAEADDLNQFWNNLWSQKDLMKEIPLDHWDYRPWYDENRGVDKTYCKWGSFINDVDKFDANFFNIAPREAEWMDPQLRLLLESIYAAGEDAGYINQLRGTNTGVFVGVCSHDYTDKIAEMNYPVDPYTGTGNSQTVIANRVSFSFDFTGPSLAVDTACSSSLFALHYACNALRNKECDMAFVGGVNLLLSSLHYRYFSSISALSPTGRCHTFDEAADGYIPGECVASILLKPLQQAKRDGDHIYAVIKGSAALHGGYTPSLTAPSVTGEENVILKAWEDAGINPEALGYIEAHGTGTKLGDPIEIDSLKKAFKRFTKKEQFCAIGSAKAHIGHAEGAAGIAGIIKVILQMKQRQIPAMPKFNKLNPYIQLDKSPFYINQELEEWKSPVGVSRIAGVSSFGFSGAYAHVVIEEYISDQEKPEITITSQNPAIIVLSAKNEERLKEQSQQLLTAIQTQKFSDADLAAIAYTLQVGREAMEERLAITAVSLQDLKKKLQGYLDGQDNIDDLYRGQVKRNKDTLAVFTVDKDLQKAIDAWIDKGKYAQFLDLWVKGLSFDWNKLYPKNKPRCISLPTYPFAKERYWLPEIETKTNVTSTSTAFIHPLLHQNTSDLVEQRFTSTFTGREFFLADHVVKGESILPGVAYLEMARAAVQHGAGALQEGKTQIKLKNIIWARPIAVGDKSVQVHIGLYSEDNQIAYEIYSRPDEAGAEPIVHCQGVAVLSAAQKAPALDLGVLKTQCAQNAITSSQLYEAYQTMGLDYGPAHQGIEQLYIGQNQILARLVLPASVFATQGQFILHPSLMDSALQASLGLMLSTGARSSKPILPFALEEIEVFGSCVPSMWAHVRPIAGGAAGDRLQKLDIDLYNDQGNICVRMKAFTSRILEVEMDQAGQANLGTLLLEPSWREQTVNQEPPIPEYTQRLVILCEPGNISPKDITSQVNKAICLILKSSQKIEERFQTYAIQVFEKIQSLLMDKPKDQVLIQVVVSTQSEQLLYSGLAGLLKTAQLENPKLIGQLIEVEPGQDPETIIARLQENSRRPMDHQIRYQDGKRWVAGLSEMEVSTEKMEIPWKDQGVYLITGGVGGLGLIFAQEITRRVQGATLILTGRSPLGEDRQAKLKELETSDARITYQQVDVTDKKATIGLIKNIQQEYGHLNGIIHSAGVIKDNFIFKKTREEYLAVLAPKVAGLVNLDQASQDLNLDFFILFSSISGSFGNPGQADYAAANAFMDAYASYRHDLVASGQRYGRTLSVNWPLWQDGGMSVDEETEKRMSKDTGIVLMQTQAGIQALYQGMASGKPQTLVAEGNLARMRQILLAAVKPFASQPEQILKTPDGLTASAKENILVMAKDLLQERAIDYFKKLLSSVIKLPAQSIEADAPLEKYGIDSIMVMQLTNQLEKTFGSLSKTLFFEYQNIKDLAGHFLESHRDQLTDLLGSKEMVAAATAERSEDVTVPVQPALSSKRSSRFASPRLESEFQQEKGKALDIAIIGLSGRYPEARNIEEFWQNLKNGKDCITEIPKERWNHSLYFDEDKDKFGKTYSKWGGFIEGVDQFDPLFFNISPKEAEIMDPQGRLFLQCVYETLEDAGYTREALGAYRSFGLGGNVGVYVGVMYEEYQLYGAQEQIQGRMITLTGSPAAIANRVSYFCNFNGPSMGLDTMCSSSLTAIHLACESLRRGGCELAIAGGVNVSIHPNKYLMLGQGKFVSSKGRCESFGREGDGYVPGEGVGAVLLKPLSKAIADGDHIYGVIKATALNHGGKTNGFSVPNPNAQTSVIGDALKEAGINPRLISYIEAHGTGTSLGDPIEITGLTKAFQEYTRDKQFCAIGSAKSNIGHCESAAGIAGLTKILLQLKYRQLVPSLHSEVLNPNIDFINSPFVVQQDLAEWKRPMVEINGETKEYPRVAGISSFGAGGSNAHIVIEEYIPQDFEGAQIMTTPQNPAVIVLSAKSEVQLQEQAQRLLAAINEQHFADKNLANIAYTLQVGREAMEERLGLIVGSIKELEEKLKDYLKSPDGVEDLYRGQVKRNKEALAIFATDEEMAKIVDVWIAKRNYGKVLDLWVKGLIVDWNKLYTDKKPLRISLPTYPFAKERYWVPETTEPIETNSMPLQSNIQFNDAFYDQIMDEIMNETISIDVAVQKAKKVG